MGGGVKGEEEGDDVAGRAALDCLGSCVCSREMERLFGGCLWLCRCQAAQCGRKPSSPCSHVASPTLALVILGMSSLKSLCKTLGTLLMVGNMFMSFPATLAAGSAIAANPALSSSLLIPDLIYIQR